MCWGCCFYMFCLSVCESQINRDDNTKEYSRMCENIITEDPNKLKKIKDISFENSAFSHKISKNQAIAEESICSNLENSCESKSLSFDKGEKCERSTESEPPKNTTVINDHEKLEESNNITPSLEKCDSTDTIETNISSASGSHDTLPTNSTTTYLEEKNQGGIQTDREGYSKLNEPEILNVALTYLIKVSIPEANTLCTPVPVSIMQIILSSNDIPLEHDQLLQSIQEVYGRWGMTFDPQETFRELCMNLGRVLYFIGPENTTECFHARF